MGQSGDKSTANVLESITHSREVPVRTQAFDQNLDTWLQDTVFKHQPSNPQDPLTAEAHQALKKLFDELIAAGKKRLAIDDPDSKKTTPLKSKIVGCWDDVVREVGIDGDAIGADTNKKLPQDSSYLAALGVYSENSSLPAIDAETWTYLLYGLHDRLLNQCLTEGVNRPDDKDQSHVDVSLDHQRAKKLLEQWHDFFDLYQKVRQKQFYWKARVLAFFYALTQGMVGMMAVLLCVIPVMPFLAASPAWAAYVISGSIGFLALFTNFRLGVVMMEQSLPCAKSAWAAFWACWRSESYRKYSIIKRHKWSLVGGTFLCICGAVVMAVLNFGGATTELPKFIQQVGAQALGQVGLLTAGVVIAGVVAIFELYLFVKSCVDIVHQGGFFSVIRNAFRQAMGEQSSLVKGMAVFFLVLMLLSNLTGLTFMVFGSVGDMRTMLGSAEGLAGTMANVASWAIATAAAVGMLFFFVRSALGWSYDMGQCVKYRKVIASKLMTHWRFWLRNTVRIAGLVACIALGASGVGWGVALAVLLASMVANVLVAQLLKKAHMHDLPDEKHRSNDSEDEPDTQLSIGNAPEAPINATTFANGLGNAAITGVGLEANPMVPNVAIAPAVGTLALSSMSNVHPSLLKIDIDPALSMKVISRWENAGAGSSQHIKDRLAQGHTVDDTDSVGCSSEDTASRRSSLGDSEQPLVWLGSPWSRSSKRDQETQLDGRDEGRQRRVSIDDKNHKNDPN